MKQGGTKDAKLGTTRASPPIEQALRKGKAQQATYQGLEYLRLTDASKHAPRGTAVLGETTVFGYPGIGRVLALKPGLDQNFAAPFWVEEKINGYNVRVFRLDDRVLALTRGGFVCPFTTDRLADLLDLDLFEDAPDLVVCGEVAGPDNPYLESSPPFVSDDVRLFVFDTMRLNRPGFQPQSETYTVVERYQFDAVQHFGRHSHEDIQAIQDILRRLNDEGREGLVFKEDSPRNRRAKDVTSDSSISDIRATAANIMELPPEYYTNRILRLVLFLREQGLEHSTELDRQLGAAFLDGLLAATRQFEADQKVYHTYRCRFRQRDNALALLNHMEQVGGHQVQISRRDLREEEGYWVLEFDKLYPGLTGLLANLLSGGMIFD